MKKLKKIELNSKQMTEEELKHIIGGNYENEFNWGCESDYKSSYTSVKMAVILISKTLNSKQEFTSCLSFKFII